MALPLRLKVIHPGPLQGRLKVAVQNSPWLGEHICSNKIFLRTPTVPKYLSPFASVFPQRIVHAIVTSFPFFSSQLKIVPLKLGCVRHSQFLKIIKYQYTIYDYMSADISISCLKFIKYLPCLQNALTVIFLQ